MTQPSPTTERIESDADRRERLAWEAARIAEARASARAGHVVPSEAVEAWIESLDTEGKLPPPLSGR